MVSADPGGTFVVTVVEIMVILKIMTYGTLILNLGVDLQGKKGIRFVC